MSTFTAPQLPMARSYFSLSASGLTRQRLPLQSTAGVAEVGEQELTGMHTRPGRLSKPSQRQRLLCSKRRIRGSAGVGAQTFCLRCNQPSHSHPTHMQNPFLSCLPQL